ncbi:unnamed protein product [Polarella glacialis]|uniref:Rhamnosyl O-methyltransferase n=1 Tax=Polarella glacialis TaxID=89957 RepID=A0A813G1K8_POLGL|nr:unnamed protein product [Polarella glacialis]
MLLLLPGISSPRGLWLGILVFGNAAVDAQLGCYQPAFTAGCCVSEQAEVLPQKDPRCGAFGHKAIQSTEYLLPPNMSGAGDRSFQEAFLKQGIFNTVTYMDCSSTWLGVTNRQPPQDLMIFQQLLFSQRPRLFIETGTYRGGMAYFVASMFHLMEMPTARVITIDQRPKEYWEMSNCSATGLSPSPVGELGSKKLWRHYVREVVADSVSATALAVVKEELRKLPVGSPVIVSLDSDHKFEYVWKEILVYAPLVPLGSFLVVQDVILSFAKHPWTGPWQAVQRLLNSPAPVRRRLGTFTWDRSVEIFGYTGHAYLRRVA